VDEGFYANFHFEAEPAAIEKVRNRLKLNGDVFLQHVLRKSA
jgi:ribosomal protein S6